MTIYLFSVLSGIKQVNVELEPGFKTIQNGKAQIVYLYFYGYANPFQNHMLKCVIFNKNLNLIFHGFYESICTRT